MNLCALRVPSYSNLGEVDFIAVNAGPALAQTSRETAY